MQEPHSTTSPSAMLSSLVKFAKEDHTNFELVSDALDHAWAEGQLVTFDEMLNNALKVWPEESRFINRQAMLAIRRGEYARAVTLLSPICLAQKGTAPAVSYNLAYAQYQLANYQATKDALAPVIGDANALPEIAPLFMLALHQLGQLDEAVEFGTTYLQHRPNDPDVSGVLALIYLDRSDLSQCKHLIDAALAQRPNHPMALIAGSAMAIMDEDADRAVGYAESVIQQNAQDGRGWSSLGVAQLLKQDLEGANSSLSKAVQLLPNHIGTWHALGWVQILRKDAQDAERCFNRALELDRTLGDTHGGLAVVAAMNGDRAKATALIERAKRLDPKSLAYRYAELILLAESGRQDEARALLLRSLKRAQSFKGDSLLDVVGRMRRKI